MDQTLLNILFFTFLGSIVSLAGGALLLLKEKVAFKFAHYLASFAAGALLGTAFFDLLPEAHHLVEETGGETDIFFWGLLGVLGFFLIERSIHWYHHHHEHQKHAETTKPTVPLIVLGDSIHNFIDGVTIAAAFLVDINLGIVTTMAVALHEIPQEIGDFGILLHAGIKRVRILFYNFISALTAVLGALLTYFIGAMIEPALPAILALTGGFFIYIAASDLIPEIHNQDDRNIAFLQSALLILGVLVVYTSISLLSHGH